MYRQFGTKKIPGEIKVYVDISQNQNYELQTRVSSTPPTHYTLNITHHTLDITHHILHIRNYTLHFTYL